MFKNYGVMEHFSSPSPGETCQLLDIANSAIAKDANNWKHSKQIAQTSKISYDFFNSQLVCKLINLFCLDAAVTSFYLLFIHNHQTKEIMQCVTYIFVVDFLNYQLSPGGTSLACPKVAIPIRQHHID